MEKIKLFLALAAMTLLATACSNRQFFDTTYTFNYAYIELPNGEIVEGKVDSWRDFDGDQLQIKIDGVSYLTDTTRATLVTEKPE